MRLLWELSSVRSARGKSLLIIYNSPVSSSIKSIVEVNSSFAELYNLFKNKEFCLQDVADALAELFALSNNEAAQEAQETIKLWQKLGLIQK
ncbi:MAG: hypothetical protein IKI67_03585 [Bacteroidales bacterium]|nr:hypothetical protein [Bacteroidales bacterium]